MQLYRFQFTTEAGQAGDTVESSHSSDRDAMCDAVRTVAEMLKEQANGQTEMKGFSVGLHDRDGRDVGGIEVIISGPAACL